MPQAEAFCEEHGRNITLVEAHKLYFAQPEGKRRRFTFRCGDPRCRAMLQPKVVGALYDREKSEDEKKLRSPYYREIAKYKHILNCTWKNDDKTEPSDPATPLLPKPSNPIEEDLGLIFKLKAKKTGGGKKTREPQPDEGDRDDDDFEGDADIPSEVPSQPKARAETSRFMATVAMKYLQYTDEELKSIELTLEGIRKAPFYNICMPIFAFHPYYQSQQIYRGSVKVHALTNVFFLRFVHTMSPSGDKEARTTVAEIKLLKSWLEGNDRALAAVLTELAAAKRTAWCFFYTTEPVEMKLDRAQFTITDAHHIAVIDESEIERMNTAE